MEYDHWDNNRAIEELKATGYTNLENEWDVLGYLEHYRPTWQHKHAAAPRQLRVGQVKRW